MLEQGQQADVTLAFNSLEQSRVPLSRIQSHVVVEDVGDSSSTNQQVDELLRNTKLFPGARFHKAPNHNQTKMSRSNSNQTCVQ